MEQQYRYLGDKQADNRYKQQVCVAVRRPNGKCIRGRNGNMLVTFGDKTVVVLGKLLRKIKPDMHG